MPNAWPNFPSRLLALAEEYALAARSAPCISGSAAGRRHGLGTRTPAIALYARATSKQSRSACERLASEDARLWRGSARACRRLGCGPAASSRKRCSAPTRSANGRYLTQLLLLDARIADGLGEPERARESIRQAIAEARLQEAPWLELAALSARCERPDASAKDFAALAHVVEQLTEGIDTAPVARARELLKRRRGASTSARR